MPWLSLIVNQFIAIIMFYFYVDNVRFKNLWGQVLRFAFVILMEIQGCYIKKKRNCCKINCCNSTGCKS